MRRIIKLSESELKEVMRESVRRALIHEHVNMEHEIVLAQKLLVRTPLSEIGLRLEGTQFYTMFKRMRDATIELNEALIKHIRGGK